MAKKGKRTPRDQQTKPRRVETATPASGKPPATAGEDTAVQTEKPWWKRKAFWLGVWGVVAGIIAWAADPEKLATFVKAALASDTGLTQMIASLERASDSVRAVRLSVIDDLLDRQTRHVPRARTNLIAFVHAAGRRTALDTACQAPADPEVRRALEIAVKPREGRRWFIGPKTLAPWPSTRFNLDNTNLNGANLERGDFRVFSFRGACLRGVTLTGADLDGVSLDSARLDGARLEAAQLRGARLDEASLRGAQLSRANLSGAYLTYANLDDAVLDSATLDTTVFRGARLQRARMVGALGARTSFFKARMEGATLVGDSLPDASFLSARLACAALDGAYLAGATFELAHMPWVSLNRTQLSGVRNWPSDEGALARAFFAPRAGGDSLRAQSVQAGVRLADSIMVDWQIEQAEQLRGKGHCVQLAGSP